MSAEVYYFPSPDTPPVTLEKLLAALAAKGLAPKSERDGEKLLWIVFPDYESTLLVSVDSGGCGLVTLHHAFSATRDAAIPAIIDELMFDLDYEEAET